MTLLTWLASGLIGVVFLFLLLCVNPHGNNPLSLCARTIYYTLPEYVNDIFIRYFGQGTT